MHTHARARTHTDQKLYIYMRVYVSRFYIYIYIISDKIRQVIGRLSSPSSGYALDYMKIENCELKIRICLIG